MLLASRIQHGIVLHWICICLIHTKKFSSCLCLSVTVPRLHHIHRILGDSIIIPSACISCVVLGIADCWISGSTVQVAMQVMAPEDVLLTCYFFIRSDCYQTLTTGHVPKKKMSSFLWQIAFHCTISLHHFMSRFAKKNILFWRWSAVLTVFCTKMRDKQKGSPLLVRCTTQLPLGQFPGLQQLGGFL